MHADRRNVEFARYPISNIINDIRYASRQYDDASAANLIATSHRFSDPASDCHYHNTAATDNFSAGNYLYHNAFFNYLASYYQRDGRQNRL
jgi:hypothetical protein